jgi:hypothetical protein
MESNTPNAVAIRVAVSKIPTQIDAIRKTLEEYLDHYPFDGNSPDELIDEVIDGHAEAQQLLDKLAATVAALPQFPREIVA